ncbi:MAG: hypothetical protein EBU22_04400 [Actinobacteria bacterium]|nr:hypothetical protein [Actinomycetota bacterium]NCU80597.1 hypothetical protein [Acidimicrobiia bacterium]NDC99311.1 hypothetical protein [bacterium]HBQ51558.1 hypothetical protein [Acidimicrobium sp.]NBQ04527.1 hypothetical protein [Actinomycetota bacterium]
MCCSPICQKQVVADAPTGVCVVIADFAVIEMTVLTASQTAVREATAAEVEVAEMSQNYA